MSLKTFLAGYCKPSDKALRDSFEKHFGVSGKFVEFDDERDER